MPTATDIAQFDNSNTTTINIQQANTQVGALQFNAVRPAGTYTFNITGTVGGASSLVIQGDGIADISGNVPTFVVSGVSGAPGTLQFNNSSTADDAIITTNAFGQTIFTGNSTGGFARFITNAGGVVDFSGTSGPAGNNRVTVGSIEGAGTYNLGSNMLIVGINGLSTTVSGTINDGGASGGVGASLVKLGGGTLTLSGASTYTGLTAVLGGTLQAGAINAFAASSAFTVASGATLDLASFNQTIGSLAGAGSVTLGSATLTTGNNDSSTTFAGTMSGVGGGLTKVGAGTLTLSGSSSYSGATAVNAGTLQAGAANAFASSSAFTVAGGATLDLAGFNQTIGSLAGAGSVTLGVGHADHRQRQYQHDVRRHDVRHRRGTDQGRRRHVDALRQQHVFGRDRGQRRHAAGGRGECIVRGQRVHRRERRHARSRELQPDHRLARRRRQRDAGRGHADHRQRQYQHDVRRHDVRHRRADQGRRRHAHARGRQQLFRGHHDQRRHAGGIGGQQSRQRRGRPRPRRRHLAVPGGLHLEPRGDAERWAAAASTPTATTRRSAERSPASAG